MPTPYVAICVPTYKRPKTLRGLLESLNALYIENMKIHLIIVDNDAEGSAQTVVAEWEPKLPFPVSYILEPVRGLAFVRNRLVAEAIHLEAEYIGFVDDDETADPAWLQELVQTAQTYQADGVGGSVNFVTPSGTPTSIRKCFPNLVRITGEPIQTIGTNNGLYRLDVLAGIPGPFDPRTNFTGGEDYLLSKVARSRGAKLVGSGTAFTYEHVPESKANWQWIIKRSFRIGATRTERALYSGNSLGDWIWSIGASLHSLLLGSVKLLLTPIFWRQDWLKNCMLISQGVGGIVRFLSPRARYEEYKSTQGG